MLKLFSTSRFIYDHLGVSYLGQDSSWLGDLKVMIDEKINFFNNFFQARKIGLSLPSFYEVDPIVNHLASELDFFLLPLIRLV